MMMPICNSKLIQEITSALFGYKCSSDSKASKIEISVKYVAHIPMDGCKCFTKLNTVPIQEWMAATTSVKERNTMSEKI